MLISRALNQVYCISESGELYAALEDGTPEFVLNDVLKQPDPKTQKMNISR